MYGIPTIPVVTQTLTAANNFVTLYYSSPGGTPRHLFLRTSTQATSGNPNLFLRFNGDSGSNYNSQVLYGYSTTTGAWAGTSQTSMSLIGNIDDLSNTFSISETLFPDALSTRTHKSAVSLAGRLEEVVELGVGRWENTAAIASVTCFLDSSTFAAGSTFELAVVDEAYAVKETINTGTAQFDESSISAADGDLVIIGNLRSDVSSNIEELGLQFNNDSTDGNYIRQRMTGHNNSIKGAYSSASTAVSHTAAANADANSFSGFIAQIPNFSDGSNDRIALTLGGGHVSDSDQQLAMMSLRRDSTDAINRIGVVARNGSGWLANSMLSIYAVPKGQITRTELSEDASSVAFTSIPQTYDHLEVTAYVRDDRSATSDDILMSLTPVGGSNDTTDANYDTQLLQGAGSTLTAAQSAADRTVGNISSANETANAFGVLTITLVNYAKTDRHKHSLSVSGRAASATGIYFRSNRWENTAAIEAITFTPSAGSNFVAGSVFSLRGISATPSSSNIDDVNGIAIANVQAINGIAIGSVQELNDIENAVAGGGTSYQGITWSTDDNFPAATRQTISSGTMGAKLNTDTASGTGGTQFRSYEHDGSSWASGVATGGIEHTSGAGGGTQGAAIMFAGYDSGDENDSTEEYNGSSWSTVNNMVQGHAYCAGGGIVQTAQLVSGGSSYNPTARNLTMTQTYDGTNWSNESVASHGAGAGTQGESAGGGLDAFLVADGNREDSSTTPANSNLISQIFNQTAGTWTTKATVNSHTWYNASGTDGTRVFKIAGMGGTSVESWVDNSWSTESALPASRSMGGLGTGGLGASGAVAHVAGRDNSDDSNVNTYYKSVATS